MRSFDWNNDSVSTRALRSLVGDRLKGLLWPLRLDFPVIVLVLKLVDWTGRNWWIWAWQQYSDSNADARGSPAWIMPLFNSSHRLPTDRFASVCCGRTADRISRRRTSR